MVFASKYLIKFQFGSSFLEMARNNYSALSPLFHLEMAKFFGDKSKFSSQILHIYIADSYAKIFVPNTI